MSEGSRVPFVLSLVGLTISAGAALIVGLAALGVFGANFNTMGGMMGGYSFRMDTQSVGMPIVTNGYSPWGMSSWGALTWLWVPMLITSLTVAVLGVVMINSLRKTMAEIGLVLLLVASVLAFPTVFGFVLGSALMVLGGALRLIWWPNQVSPS